MEKETINDQEIFDHVDNSITWLDDQRLKELNSLKQIQQIKQEVLKSEKERLLKKYGEDHPGVQKISARLNYNQEMFAGLDKEIARASTKTEPLPANAWRANGKVFDEKDMPVAGITVFFSDGQKNWIRELGSSCSDDTGYYSLTLNEDLVKVYIEKKQALYLSASDKKQQLLCRDKDPLFPVSRLINYRDIHLGGEGCVPPPSSDASPRKTNPRSKPK